MYNQEPHIAENITEQQPSVDYAYFALWKEAAPFITEIRAYLANRFEILLETKISWSKAHFKQNAARLYEVPLYEDGKNGIPPVDHSEKIGDPKFTMLVVKDINPTYRYHRTVSGNIELSNSAIVEAKHIFRNWVASTSEKKYAVHSSINSEEFCFQISLLLGVENFNALVSGKKLDIPSLQKDLEGAGGWETATELFSVLNCATKYLVLRNFESLPNISSLNDLDFLTTKYQRLASALGVVQKATKPYKGTVAIGGSVILVDIRFVGDAYYCSPWAVTMLRKRVCEQAVFTPAPDDYFFSLLYHALVQKPTIEDKYKTKLFELAQTLQLAWFSEEILQNEQQSAAILRGYMGAHGYYYESPIDPKVYENKKITSLLPKQSSVIAKKSLKIKIKQVLLTIVPKRWYFYYLKFRTGKGHDSRD